METTRILLAVICFAGMVWCGLPGGSALREVAASRRAPRNDEVCLVLRIAKGEIGVREATGHNDGKSVEEYLGYVGLKKGDPYCAAWVSWVFGQAEFKEPRTGWSPGLFPASRVVEGEVAASRRAPRNDERERTAVSGVVEGEVAASRRAPRNDGRESIAMSGRERTAMSGLVFGIYFPALKRIAHCGLVERMQGDFCVTIEANTNSQGGRDGDGVFRRLRHRRTIAKFADWFNK